MKKLFGIICLLGVTSAGPLTNKIDPIPFASCDIFKNDTQRAVLLQDLSIKFDKNGDGSLSAKEFDALDSLHSKCYDNYQNTGKEYCKWKSTVRYYDQDQNNEISGQEICGFWKFIADDFDERFNEWWRRKDLDNIHNVFAYEGFSKDHPELISMTKDKFIDWIKTDLHLEEKTKGDIGLQGDLLFIFLDEDMSGVLDSYEENVFVYELYLRFGK